MPLLQVIDKQHACNYYIKHIGLLEYTMESAGLIKPILSIENFIKM